MKGLRLSQIAIALVMASLNVASNLAASLIASTSNFIWVPFLSAAIIGGIVYFFVKPRVVHAHIKPPLALRTKEEQECHAKRGLILTLGLYTPFPKSAAYNLTPGEREEAAKNLNYNLLDFENSNFAPLIAAIRVHASRLEYIWLLNTQSTNQATPGSNQYLPVLKSYLENELTLACEINRGYDCAIPLKDDDAITVKARNLVDNIYVLANQLGLRDEDIISDITGGTTAIKLGIILACLDGHRKVQFMGTHYGPDGRPVGDLFALLIDYSPEVPN